MVPQKISADLISKYCEGYDIRSYIFRFVSILGDRYTHGHVFDFVKQLKYNKKYLHVLGDGNQKILSSISKIVLMQFIKE